MLEFIHAVQGQRARPGRQLEGLALAIYAVIGGKVPAGYTMAVLSHWATMAMTGGTGLATATGDAGVASTNTWISYLPLVA